MDNIIRRIIQSAFVGLLIFEILCWTKVIDITLEFTWRGLFGTALTVFLFLEICSYFLRKRGIGSLHAVAYAAAFIVVFFDAFGDMTRLYGAYAWYDQVMHVAGGGASAFVFWSIFKRVIAPESQERHSWLVTVLAFGIASASGILYEAEEYLEDVFTGSNRLGSGPDTANDLLLNSLGIIIALLLVKFFRKRKHTHVN